MKKMAWMYTKTISSEILLIFASWFLPKKKKYLLVEICKKKRKITIMNVHRNQFW